MVVDEQEVPKNETVIYVLEDEKAAGVDEEMKEKKEKVKNEDTPIIFCLDTSGSMNEKQMPHSTMVLASKGRSLLNIKSYNPQRVYLGPSRYALGNELMKLSFLLGLFSTARLVVPITCNF